MQLTRARATADVVGRQSSEGRIKGFVVLFMLGEFRFAETRKTGDLKNVPMGATALSPWVRKPRREKLQQSLQNGLVPLDYHIDELVNLVLVDASVRGTQNWLNRCSPIDHSAALRRHFNFY